MFIMIISLIALIVFVCSMDLGWNNLVSSGRNDLVFEGRNTEYGAFVHRREHHRNVFYSLFLSIGLIGGGFLAVSAFRSAPVQKIIDEGIHVDPFILPPLPPKPKVDPPQKPSTAHTTAAASAGATNTTVDVVDHTETNPDMTTNPGGGEEGPEGPDQPYDPGSEGGGTGDDKGSSKPIEIRDFAIHMPEFPGGNEKLIAYIIQRVRYSEMEIERNVSGTMYVSFVVGVDGNVTDFKVERGIQNGDGLARKTRDAILGMPKWKPGDNGGDPVPVMMRMPLHFELRN